MSIPNSDTNSPKPEPKNNTLAGLYLEESQNHNKKIEIPSLGISIENNKPK